MSKKVRPLLATLSLAFGAACATATAPLVPAVYTLQEAADSVSVPIGGSATIDRIVLTFNDVTADSRCPTDVVCVWAGDATVRVTLALACTRSTPPCEAPERLADLHTTLEPQSVTYSGLEIKLVGLRPAPLSTRPIRRAQYVAWFRVRPVQ